AGLLLESWAESTFRAPALVAVWLARMGGGLWGAARRARGRGTGRPGTPADAVLIGRAPGAGGVPGGARGGGPVDPGLFPADPRVRFLLATPITAGAALHKVPQLLREGGDRGPVLIGMAAAAVTGFLAIRLLLAYVRTRDYQPFVVYRLAFAVVVAIVLLTR